MAAFPLRSQCTGDTQQGQHIRTLEQSLRADMWENPAVSNTHNSSLLQSAQALNTVLEGYTFFKADALPGRQATWTRAERTPMLFSQSKLFEMMRKRAFKVSAAQQYFRLEKTLQMHINRLIHDRKVDFPDALWSCAYAKVHKRSSKMRNAGERDRETVAVDVVLMKRLNTGPYPTSPMGELVEVTVPSNVWSRNTQSSHTLYTEANSPESQSSSEEVEMKG